MSSKLALGVPVKQIWKHLREIFSIEIKEMTNYLYVASEKIKHVGYEKKVNYKRWLHPDHNTSKFLIARKPKKKNFNIVLVYKPEGGKTLIGPKMYGHVILKNDAFAFAFQTEEIKHV